MVVVAERASASRSIRIHARRVAANLLKGLLPRVFHEQVEVMSSGILSVARISLGDKQTSATCTYREFRICMATGGQTRTWSIAWFSSLDFVVWLRQPQWPCGSLVRHKDTVDEGSLVSRDYHYSVRSTVITRNFVRSRTIRDSQRMF